MLLKFSILASLFIGLGIRADEAPPPGGAEVYLGAKGNGITASYLGAKGNGITASYLSKNYDTKIPTIQRYPGNHTQGGFTLHIVNKELGIDIHPWCQLTREFKDDSVVANFVVTNSLDYLHPCFDNNGVTMECHSPPATCGK